MISVNSDIALIFATDGGLRSRLLKDTKKQMTHAAMKLALPPLVNSFGTSNEIVARFNPTVIKKVFNE